MKKKLFRLAAALLLSLSLLCVTAFAASEYGVIYDETSSLGSDTLTLLGENTLPLFSEQLGVELRVDVLTLMSADTIEDAAHSIYRTYDYGFGDDKRGVTLTIYMEPAGSTYVMAPGNWCIYVGDYDESFTGGTLRDTVTVAVEPYMADQAWNGDDLTMSATALPQATEAMLNSVSDYLLGEVPDSGDPVKASPWGGIAIAVVASLLISLVICLILKGKMKSVSRKAEANAYVASGGLTLTGRQDLYAYTTETRRSKSKDSGSFSGDGGGHGRSGKF